MDRLSSLPDSLLCHILSFLPTKSAVATSLLGRRWRHLWNDVPCLDFDTDDFPVSGAHGMQFSDIFYRVMLLHNSRRLNTFSLSSENFINKHQFDAWIIAIVARSIQKIEIGFPGLDEGRVVRLPHCLFACKTLVDLKLHRNVIIPADCAVNLPCLKKLHLDSVEYENDKSLPHLLSGCLVLEDLTVERNFDDGVFCCDIFLSTLKSLTLRFYLFVYSPDDKYTLKISTPALEFLVLRDYSWHRISAGKLSHLIEADILLFHHNNLDEDASGYRLSIIKLVERLQNVKFLKLFSHMKFFKSESLVPARFHNLTKLNLCADWCLLSTFLEFADNLQVLIIREVDDELKCWREPHHVPKCMLSCLRTVSFVEIRGKQCGLEMLRYILWNAKVLMRMEICPMYCAADSEEMFHLVKKKSSFPRGSETCELAFN